MSLCAVRLFLHKVSFLLFGPLPAIVTSWQRGLGIDAEHPKLPGTCFSTYHRIFPMQIPPVLRLQAHPIRNIDVSFDKSRSHSYAVDTSKTPRTNRKVATSKKKSLWNHGGVEEYIQIQKRISNTPGPKPAPSTKLSARPTHTNAHQ